MATFMEIMQTMNRMPEELGRDLRERLAADTSVEHVHPHKFRRTLATDLARHGMPIQ